jgi:prepilin-type N-terminal cleavage/methylation domain-containing protein
MGRNRSTRRGFTLIELLVVIAIIATLASMVFPAIYSSARSTRIANTEQLLMRVSLALDMYRDAANFHPPDFIPKDAKILSFDGDQLLTGPPVAPIPPLTREDAYPAEALHYYLANAYLTPKHPVLNVRASAETMDINRNGLPEIVDPWGKPILYNRPAFPGCAAGYYNYQGDPKHNYDRFDLYSVGPDGQTGGNDLPSLNAASLGIFFQRAMDGTNDGEGDDDIRNWKKQ